MYYGDQYGQIVELVSNNRSLEYIDFTKLTKISTNEII